MARKRKKKRGRHVIRMLDIRTAKKAMRKVKKLSTRMKRRKARKASKPLRKKNLRAKHKFPPVLEERLPKQETTAHLAIL